MFEIGAGKGAEKPVQVGLELNSVPQIEGSPGKDLFLVNANNLQNILKNMQFYICDFSISTLSKAM